jgi:hypothetical protein
MTTWNDITGDPLVSRTLSKKGEETFEQIFGKKKTNGGWKPPLAPLVTEPINALCNVCGKVLNSTKECAWTSCPLNWDEARVDTIGQNGNNGEHYGEI